MENLPGDNAPGLPGPGSDKAAKDVVSMPAILLMVLSGLGVLLGLVNMMATPALMRWLLASPQLPEQYEPALEQALADFSPWKALPLLVLSAAVFFGAFQMLNLRNYGLAMAAAIIACIPCYGSCCCLGMPFGIWAIILLVRPEVKTAFR
ncbi:hypothetical protein [Archangium sp.]|uniref:hypothetical protein n=1 Tax=Archangium sp. TaxID=1872627 RepID=UPI002D52500C|nr:hypothetical protein [Archangium sp.]HYO58780.1 hypothetical protein [Archangium sp.]